MKSQEKKFRIPVTEEKNTDVGDFTWWKKLSCEVVECLLLRMSVEYSEFLSASVKPVGIFGKSDIINHVFFCPVTKGGSGNWTSY